MSLDIRVDGDDELAARLDPKLLAKPLRNLLTRVGITVTNNAKRRTRVKTGRLRASETSEVDPGFMPIWVKIGSNVLYAPYREAFDGMFARGLDDSAGDIGRFALRAEDEIAQALTGGT